MCNFSFAQQIAGQFDEYSKKYPNEDVVGLQKITEVTLEIDDNKVVIEKNEKEDNYFLTQHAGNYSQTSLEFESYFSEITDLKAYTLVPNGNRFDKIKVKEISSRKVLSNDIFYDGTHAKEFTFPALQKGAKTHLEYSRILKEPRFFGRFFFSNYYPVEHQKLVLQVEDGIQIDFSYFNCSETDFDFKTYNKGKNTFYVWEKHNIPKLYFEENGPDFLSLAPHIICRVLDYKTKDGETIDVSRNLADLYKWYSTHIDAVVADSLPVMPQVVDSIRKYSQTDREVVRGIYKWVQNHISYIAIENGLGGFVPRAPTLVCKRRYGDCKDMASLLVQMLRQAGITANYTFIGTQDIPYSFEEVPMIFSVNHMIAAWKENGKYMFLDPTAKNVPFGIPSSFVQGKTALIYLGPDEFETVKVPILPASSNKSSTVSTFQFENGKIKGTLNHVSTGYFSEKFRGRTAQLNEANRQEMYEAWFGMGNKTFSINMESVKVEPADVSHFSCDFELENYVVTNGDELYINMILKKSWNGSIIPETRKQSFIYQLYYSIENENILQIPEGYTLTYLPENTELSHPEFSFSIKYKKLPGSKISCTYFLETSSLELEPDTFDEWNDFARKLKTASSQSLVLKKNKKP